MTKLKSSVFAGAFAGVLMLPSVIYGGQVHAVEAVFESMPANSPTGWE